MKALYLDTVHDREGNAGKPEAPLHASDAHPG